MASPTDPHRIEVGWEDYYRLIERLALMVHASGFRFDVLLCLARGGLRAGDVLSRLFSVPLSILAASSYREAAGTRQGELDIARFITGVGAEPRGRVLLVDDLVDSGATLQGVARHLRARYPQIEELRTAVLWAKAASRVRPDFVVRPLAGNPWIVQPFEAYEALGIEGLVRERGIQGDPP